MRYCFSKGRCGAGIGSTFGFFFDRELKLLGCPFFTSYLLVVYTQNLLPALIDILLEKIQLAATVEGSLAQFFGRFCNLNYSRLLLAFLGVDRVLWRFMHNWRSSNTPY